MNDPQTMPSNPQPWPRIRKAKAQPPKAEPAAELKSLPRRFPVVRPIAPGSAIDPAATVTILVDKNPKLPHAKNWAYFQALIDGSKAGLTVGEIVDKHKDLPIVAEVRHAYERRFIDISVEPIKPASSPLK